MLAYVAACLSREMALCGDILVRESASRTNAPNTPAVHQRTGAVRSFGTTLTLVVFASSMYACWSCFYKNERSHLLHDIHLSRLSRWVSDIASKTVSANPLLQFLATYLKHLLQGLVYLPLQAAKPTVDVRDSIIADQRPPPVFGNALFMCAAVLVAPNVLRIWQVSSLQRIRTQSHLLLGLAATTSFGSPLPLKTQQQPDPRRTAAEALLAGHRVLENLPFIASADDQAQRSTGWTAEGPDIMAGVEMNGVSIMHLGRVVLKVFFSLLFLCLRAALNLNLWTVCLLYFRMFP